jgi:hypothetical protein
LTSRWSGKKAISLVGDDVAGLTIHIGSRVASLARGVEVLKGYP